MAGAEREQANATRCETGSAAGGSCTPPHDAALVPITELARLAITHAGKKAEQQALPQAAGRSAEAGKAVAAEAEFAAPAAAAQLLLPPADVP